MDENVFRRYLSASRVAGGEYAAGYGRGLRAYHYGDKFLLPAPAEHLSDESRFGEAAVGFRDGLAGRPPASMGAEDRRGTLQIDLPMRKKSAYVRAAHRAGMKLAPWIIEQLDRAALGVNDEKP